MRAAAAAEKENQLSSVVTFSTEVYVCIVATTVTEMCTGAMFVMFVPAQTMWKKIVLFYKVLCDYDR
jgi:hypothetical protein